MSCYPGHSRANSSPPLTGPPSPCLDQNKLKHHPYMFNTTHRSSKSSIIPNSPSTGPHSLFHSLFSYWNDYASPRGQDCRRDAHRALWEQLMPLHATLAWLFSAATSCCQFVIVTMLPGCSVCHQDSSFCPLFQHNNYVIKIVTSPSSNDTGGVANGSIMVFQCVSGCCHHHYEQQQNVRTEINAKLICKSQQHRQCQYPRPSVPERSSASRWRVQVTGGGDVIFRTAPPQMRGEPSAHGARGHWQTRTITSNIVHLIKKPISLHQNQALPWAHNVMCHHRHSAECVCAFTFLL